MEETINCTCTCTSATPIQGNQSIDPSVQANLHETAKVMGAAMSQFDTNEEKVKKANSILSKFKNYISSQSFTADVKSLSAKYKVPEKAIATNFFEKVLGTVGDIFGVVFGTIEGFCHTLIDLVGAVAHGIVNAICNLANAIGRVVTLNKTAVCQ